MKQLLDCYRPSWLMQRAASLETTAKAKKAPARATASGWGFFCCFVSTQLVY
jgi:hypothetical protein